MSTEDDAFSVQLLEEAKRFLEKSRENDGSHAFLHAALVLAYSALESHVNGLADELISRQNISLLDESLLSERAIKFRKGEWELGNSQFSRLEDRISFLIRRFSDRDSSTLPWWSELHSGMVARNRLVHPKEAVDLPFEAVERYLTAIVDALDDLYSAVFKRGHPAFGRGLQSTLSF